jgi:N-acetylneuraminic acid mutarotase
MKLNTFYLFALILTLGACKKTGTANQVSIAGFDPQNLAAFNYITINGSHFDTSATKNLVTFNGLPATVFSVEGDSVLTVIVPQNVTAGKISITVNGSTSSSANSYTVLAGSWAKKAAVPLADNPPNFPRIYGIGFAIGNTGYIGLGTANGGAFNDINAFDPVTNSWTKKSPLPIGLELASSMVINGKAYVGTGDTRSIQGYTKQFYEYDPAIDKWTAKADFPGGARQETSAYGLSDKGYAGLGEDNNSAQKDWWQYDPGTDSWTRKKDFPGSFSYGGSGFVLNGKIYICTVAECWQYDPANDSWIRKNNVPRQNAIFRGLTINNKGYLMGAETWQYDEVTDTWTQKATFTQRIGGALFSIGNKGYYGTGLGFPGNGLSHPFNTYYNSDFWEYTPD